MGWCVSGLVAWSVGVLVNQMLCIVFIDDELWFGRLVGW